MKKMRNNGFRHNTWSILVCVVMYLGVRDLIHDFVTIIFGFGKIQMLISDIIALISVIFVFERTRPRGEGKEEIKDELNYIFNRRS